MCGLRRLKIFCRDKKYSVSLTSRSVSVSTSFTQGSVVSLSKGWKSIITTCSNFSPGPVYSPLLAASTSGLSVRPRRPGGASGRAPSNPPGSTGRTRPTRPRRAARAPRARTTATAPSPAPPGLHPSTGAGRPIARSWTGMGTGWPVSARAAGPPGSCAPPVWGMSAGGGGKTGWGGLETPTPARRGRGGKRVGFLVRRPSENIYEP